MQKVYYTLSKKKVRQAAKEQREKHEKSCGLGISKLGSKRPNKEAKTESTTTIR